MGRSSFVSLLKDALRNTIGVGSPRNTEISVPNISEICRNECDDCIKIEFTFSDNKEGYLCSELEKIPSGMFCVFAKQALKFYIGPHIILGAYLPEAKIGLEHIKLVSVPMQTEIRPSYKRPAKATKKHITRERPQTKNVQSFDILEEENKEEKIAVVAELTNKNDTYVEKSFEDSSLEDKDTKNSWNMCEEETNESDDWNGDEDEALSLLEGLLG